MATLARIRVAWSGSGVTGAGVSTFYSNDSDPAVLRTALVTYFGVWKDLVPTVINWTTPTSGDTIDSATGEINGAWTGGTASTITGTLAGQGYAQGVGVRAVWNTAGIVGGRRVRGTTFMVPVSSGVYDSDGTIKSTNLVTMQGAATGLVTDASGTLVVYSRPAPGRAGTSSVVTSGTVPDKVSWLVSRRR
uniref:Uncharacterized protein n=1 Tax=uncultured prokaryote TaxID=198431 RepID=A0A0H5Q615_9ZZZZ|nr:hypothetical protein [uncultured prokaryote]